MGLVRKMIRSGFMSCIMIAGLFIGHVHAQCNNIGQCSTNGLPADCVPAPFAGGGAFGAAGSVFCIGQSVGVYNTSSGNIDYSWICWGDGTDTVFNGSFSDTIYHLYNYRPDSCFNSSNGILQRTIYIFVADSCPSGCSVTWNSFPISLRFKPHAEFSFTVNDTVCVDDQVCFNLSNACVNQSVADSIWWDFGNGALPYDTSRSFNPGCIWYSTPGTRTITLYIKNICGTSSYSRTIYVKPPTTIVPAITLTDSCAPSIVIPTLIQNNVESLWWSSNIGSDVINNNPDPTPTINLNTPGQHIIHLQAYGCCNSPQSFCNWYDTLVLAAGPVITASPQGFCQDSVTLNGNDFYSYGGTAITNYDWQFTGALPSSAASDPNPTIFFPDTGSYIVTLYATSSCGIDTVNTTLSLSQSPQLNLINTILTGCTPFAVTISDTTSITQSYYWSAPGADVTTATGSSVTFNYSTSAGSPYTISVTAYTDSIACSNVSQNFIIDVDEGVDISMTPIPDTCVAIQFIYQNYFHLIPHANDTAYLWQVFILGDTIPFCTASGFPPVPPSCILGGGGSAITYTVLATIESTCDSIVIGDTFSYSPPVPPVYLEDTICKQSGIIHFVYNPPGGNWYDANLILMPPGNDFFNPAGATHYTYTFYYKHGGTGVCQVTDTYIYHVAGWNVNAGSDLSFCSNDSCQYLIGYPAGNWWGGAGVIDHYTGYYCPVAGLATDIVTYVDTDGVCITIDTILVTGNTPVSATFTLDTVGCIGDVISLNDTIAGTSASWMIDTQPWVNSNSLNHTFIAPAATHSIWLAISDSASGCRDTLQKNIHVLAPPDAIFTLSNDGCDSLEVIVTDMSTINYSVSYLWNYGIHNTNPDTLYFHAGAGNTPVWHTIQLTATNMCGIASHSDSVRILPLPRADFGTNFADTCSPALVHFSDTSDGCAGMNCTFQWFMNDLLFYSGYTPPETLLYAGSSDAIYNVKLVTTNICGVDSVTKNVIVHPNQVHAFFNTNHLYGCIPLDVTLSDFSTPNNCTILRWDFGDPGSAGNLVYGNPVSHTYTQAGDYLIWHLADNYCGLDSVSQTIHVFGQPDVSFNTSLVNCVNEPVQFHNTSTWLSTYRWNFGDGTTDNSNFSPLHLFPHPGNFTVTLIGNSYGDSTHLCESVITKQVRIIDVPVASFALAHNDGCPPVTVELLNQTSNANYYTWKISDDFNTIANLIGDSATYTFQNSGRFSITLTAIDSNLCRDDSIFSYVNVYADPVANFEPDPVTQSIYTPVFEFNNLSMDSTNLLNYEWNFGDGSLSTDLFEPEHQYAAVGTYPVTLIVSNIYGCIDSIQKYVEVTSDFSVYIPNTFTPDDHGPNNNFIPIGAGWTTFEMWILDRWGKVIYHTKDALMPWDGNFDNSTRPCQQDVYVYKVKIQDIDLILHDYIGHVTLLR